jgi:hypothetical protein
MPQAVGRAIRACIGVLKSMKTIITLKICRELPDMYIMMAFTGSCLAGAIATSHAFFNLSVSVSSVVAGGREGVFEAVER